ncbi:MAG: hypothetical protein ACTH32_06415 [Microbacterium gubbeenense]|uniref:hypothetical protein n=1 Tax=Microbacterium gubbeenense TaxID=159896 RepID=UPI003F992021
MTDRNRIDVADGKYTVLGIEDGHLRALRHGEEWRSLTGDNLILALAQELQEARERLEAADKGLTEAWRVVSEQTRMERDRADAAEQRAGAIERHLKDMRHLATVHSHSRDAALAVIEKVRGYAEDNDHRDMPGVWGPMEDLYGILATTPADALREHDVALIEELADELEQQGVEPWDRNSVAIRTLRWKAHQRREGQS